MKLRNLFLGLLLCSAAVSAQDVIYFNIPTVPATQTPTYPTAVSNNYAQNQDLAISSAMNDDQLLKISYYNQVPELRKEAKLYRIVGWTGGAAIFLAGIVITGLIF